MRTLTLFCAITSCVSSVQAASLSFELDVTHTDSFVSPGLTQWYAAAYVNPLFSPSLVSYTLVDPSGTSTGGEDSSHVSASAAAVTRSNFADYRSAVDGAWTLDVNTDLGVSRYLVQPNLSAMAESSYVSATVLTPQPNQSLSSRPTYSWTNINRYEQGFLYTGTGAFAPVSYTTATQSYTPPVALAAGNCRFELDLDARRGQSIPLTATRISGVDQGPITAIMNFEYRVLVPYSISVPEPTTLAMMVLLPATFLRRLRNPA